MFSYKTQGYDVKFKKWSRGISVYTINIIMLSLSQMQRHELVLVCAWMFMCVCAQIYAIVTLLFKLFKIATMFIAYQIPQHAAIS